MKQILKFLKELNKNNNREWFNTHKEEYLKVKAKVEALTEQLIREVATFDQEAAYLRPADCTYRIYRDTRFSADKTPYKTHIGIFINPPMGKKSNRMGYYLHIEPGNSLVAVGTVCLPSKTIASIRRSIYDNVEEYLEIISADDFKKAFPEVGENPVKTAPKGYSKDWPYIDLIKPRDFCASHPISDKEMQNADLIEKCGNLFRISKPFNDFINYTIDNEEEA